MARYSRKIGSHNPHLMHLGHLEPCWFRQPGLVLESRYGQRARSNALRNLPGFLDSGKRILLASPTYGQPLQPATGSVELFQARTSDRLETVNKEISAFRRSQIAGGVIRLPVTTLRPYRIINSSKTQPCPIDTVPAARAEFHVVLVIRGCPIRAGSTVTSREVFSYQRAVCHDRDTSYPPHCQRRCSRDCR